MFTSNSCGLPAILDRWRRRSRTENRHFIFPHLPGNTQCGWEHPGVEFINMTRPLTGCLHDYQLTPDNLASLSKTDIFVVNGAGMETFRDKAIQ